MAGGGSTMPEMVVTRMDTPKQGWTPYDTYTTVITSNGKRSLKNQISVHTRSRVICFISAINIH